jgi:hypothetical protein
MRIFSVRKPSSSYQCAKDGWSVPVRRSSPSSALSSTRRHSRQNRSVCDAVADRANSTSAASQSGAAIRVSARTFE